MPNLRFIAVTALAFVGICPVLAAEPTPFEGMYAWAVDRGDGRPLTATTSIKGNLMKSEMVSGPRSFVTIIDFGKHESILLMPSRKMYMRSQITDLRALHDIVPPPAEQTVEPTSETATILGYACRKTIATSRINGKAVRSEFWWTDQLGTIILPGASSSAPIVRAAEALLQGRGLPISNAFVLLADITVEGSKTVRLTVTSVQPQSLDDAQFEPPADWTELRIPGAGQLPMGSN